MFTHWSVDSLPPCVFLWLFISLFTSCPCSEALVCHVAYATVLNVLLFLGAIGTNLSLTVTLPFIGFFLFPFKAFCPDRAVILKPPLPSSGVKEPGGLCAFIKHGLHCLWVVTRTPPTPPLSQVPLCVHRPAKKQCNYHGFKWDDATSINMGPSAFSVPLQDAERLLWKHGHI